MNNLLFLTQVFLFSMWVSSVKAEQKPNIVFIAMDDLRPELGAYGIARAKTPNIDRLAEGSYLFERSYVAFPLCLPSRAGMLTGIRLAQKRMPDGRSGEFKDLIKIQQTWPGVLKESGYYTATTGKFYHGDVPKSELKNWDVPGKFWKKHKDWSPEIMSKVVAEGGLKKELDEFKKNGQGGGYGLIWQSIDGDDDVLNDGQTASEAIKFIKERPKDKPFLIVAGFSRPHLPWLAPKKYFDMYPVDHVKHLAYVPEGVKKEIPDYYQLPKANGQWNQGLSDEDSKLLIRAYLAATSYVDAQMGRILQALQDEGLDKNTIVIFWGDHGYHLTEHGLWQKNTPFHVNLRNPMMIKVPGKSGAVKLSQVVEAVDLYPTILDLVNVDVPQNLQLQGSSMKPLLENPAKANWDNIAYTSSSKSTFGMVTEQYRFSFNKKETELFDLNNDPDEWHNLAKKPEYQALIKDFKAKVEREWRLK